jgi:hypothetical protein
VTHVRRALTTAALVAAAFTGVSELTVSEAHAQSRVRAGGSAGGRVHVRAGGRAHVHVGAPRGRAHVHAGGPHIRAPYVHWRVRRAYPPPLRIRVGGAIWVGGGYYGYYGPRYAAPPPPVAPCDCGPGYYHPVVPAPAATVAVAAPAPRPILPRWGVGVAAGGVNVQGQPAGDDLALLGRLRLTPGLLVEGELGKSELADGARLDRRLGASLVYEIGAYNRLAPYLVGGLGVSQVDVGDSYRTHQQFGELGVGLRLAVTPRVHIAADLRAGSRTATEHAPMADVAARVVAPPVDESEEYTRARLSGVLYF